MSPQLFYREQASQQQAAADAATLQNVRERCQRASDAWSVLALRSERADEARTQVATAKQLKAAHEDASRETLISETIGSDV